MAVEHIQTNLIELERNFGVGTRMRGVKFQMIRG
jgi:hypothetical protein